MRQGNSPEMACKLAVERIAHKNPDRAKTIQVGFIAVNKNGETGAYALCDGFTYAVKTDTETTIYDSKYLYKSVEEK
jgi:N4-(beta-N-acetylglucosaminyl)-L-asparaginase